MTTYLENFSKMAKRGIAYLPLGTLEWHGNHLPIETDYLIAARLCEELAKKKTGYILPPIYLGTDKERIRGGRKFIGMDSRLGKKLPGSLYYLKPHLFEKIVIDLGKNLKAQGFKKIYLIAGHSGTGQIKTLKRAVEKQPGLILLNPWEKISVDAHHADEYETSIFWACHPEEERKSRKMKIPASDDCFRYYGYDPRKKASLKIGRKILKEMIKNCSKVIS